jgi:hypothetical protein
MFRQDFTCPALLLVTLVPHPRFRLRGSHPLRPPFPERSANANANSNRLFPVRSPLLGESRLISLPAGTEMFQFSAFALSDLWIESEVTLAGRVSPFGHPRIKAPLPAPRGLTQACTSFFACDRQGIHHMHLLSLDPITLSTSSEDRRQKSEDSILIIRNRTLQRAHHITSFRCLLVRGQRTEDRRQKLPILCPRLDHTDHRYKSNPIRHDLISHNEPLLLPIC